MSEHLALKSPEENGFSETNGKVAVLEEENGFSETNGKVAVLGEENANREERGQWANRLEFLFAIVGYTVGTGSVWRFPIICAKNGGGAFLIPFFFFLITCGGPLYYLEVCLGQFSGKSAIAAFEFCPLFKGIGCLMVVISFLVTWYIMLILTWVLYYLVHSFFVVLPWSTCNNWWNTPQCRAIFPTSTTTNITNTSDFTGLTEPSNTTGGLHSSASFEFWQYNVLRKSAGIEDMGSVNGYLVICLFVGWVIIVLSVIKGVKSLGKVVYVTATLPYVLLTIMLIRGLTLDGAVDGIKYYITPDFSKIANINVWLEAAVQVFYSLGPSWGGVITMASYNRFNQRSIWETTFCVVTDGLTAFYCGFVVFTIIGFMAKEAGMEVAELAKVSGPGLAFIAYPTALSKMPLPQLWSVMFFIMMITVAFDTNFGMFETVTSAIVDSFPRQLTSKRTWVNVGTGFVMFLIGIPFTMQGGIYLFQLVDWYSSAFALIFGAALESLMVMWIYGADRFSRDIALMMGREVSVFLRVIWVIFIPSVLVVFFIVMLSSYSQPDYGDGYVYPSYAIAMGVMLGLSPIVAFLVIGIWEVIKAKGSLIKRITTLLQPSSHWGPADTTAAMAYRDMPYRPEQSVLRQIVTNVRGRKTTPYF